MRCALYSVRSDRLFCETLDYNLLFRWFLDMDMDMDMDLEWKASALLRFVVRDARIHSNAFNPTAANGPAAAFRYQKLVV